MLSLCPPCILLRAGQRPQPSFDTISRKPSGFPFLFLSKKRHIITKLPPIWSGPKSRLWPLQDCKANKLYSRIGLILSFWPAKRTSPSKKTPSTTGSSTPSPPTSANENAAQPRAHLLRPCGDLRLWIFVTSLPGSSRPEARSGRTHTSCDRSGRPPHTSGPRPGALPALCGQG